MNRYSVPLIMLLAVFSCMPPKKFEREAPFQGNAGVYDYTAVGQGAIFDNLDTLFISAQQYRKSSDNYKRGVLTNKDTISTDSWINVTAGKGTLSCNASFFHRMVMQVKTPTTLATLFPNEENRSRTLAHRLLYADKYKEGKEKFELKELAYIAEINMNNGTQWTMLARGEKKRPITAYVITNGSKRVMVQPWWQKFQGEKKVNGVEFIMDGARIAAATKAGTAGKLWFINGIDPETELVISAMIAGIWKLYPSIAPQLPQSIWDKEWEVRGGSVLRH